MNDASPGPRTRLLLLDDERLILATLGAGLRSAGYEVFTAENIEEAQAHLTGGARPDLAILDVNLPSSSGLDFAQRLRELEHIPFLMLSAYSDQQYVERAAQCGALGYLVKPIDVVQLVPEVQAALSRADELSGLRNTRSQLQLALDGERDVSTAVGILMAQRRLNRKTAFELLRHIARSQRRKMVAVAQDLIAEVEAL